MYELKPMFPAPHTFRKTSSMYQMKPIGKIKCSNEETEGIDLSSVSNRMLDEIILCKEEEVIAKQKELLKGLSQLEKIAVPLYERVKEMASKRSMSLEMGRVLQEINNMYADSICLTADVRNPPNSLVALCKLWPMLKISVKQQGEAPSSGADLPIVNYFKAQDTEEFDLCITLVWKNTGRIDSELLISGTRGAILGEVNFLRFFRRILFPTRNAKEEAECDSILDMAHVIPHCADDTARRAHFSTLNDAIRMSEWFSKTYKPSIADIALWSAMLNTPQISMDEYTHLKSWFKRIASFLH